MPITAQQGYNILTDIIEGDRRPMYYDRAVEIAKEAATYLAIDPEKQRHKLSAIRPKEDKEQEDQRVRLSNAITAVALAPAYSYFEEVERVDGLKKTVEGPPDTLRARVDEHLGRYFHADNLHRYCFSAALHFNKTDPNAWTVFEAIIGPTETGANAVQDLYPVEVSSQEVRGFRFDQTGTLEYLAFEFKRRARQRGGTGEKELSDFYLYGAGFSIHFAQVDPIYEAPDYAGMGYDLTDINGISYFARIATNALLEVPAIRWGAYWSSEYPLYSVAETPVAPAIPLVEELLKDNSLLQLSKYLHAFPEKWQYVRRCNHRDESGRECQYGYYGGTRRDEDMCRACKGSGKVMVSGEQDVQTLAWPERAEDLVELSRLSHYVERPIELVSFFRSEVDRAARLITWAVFNQQTTDVGEVLRQGETATKTRMDYDKIYNKLAPFAETIARAWETAQRTAYQYYGSAADADMTYPQDFKMKTVAELLDEYGRARENGVPYEVTWGIAQDLLRKQYRNAPDRAAEVAAFERWRPWKDKTPEEIVLILQSRAETDPARVLWENWDQVVEQVRLSLSGGPNFGKLPADEQRAFLYEAAVAFSASIQYQQMPDPFAQPAGLVQEPDMNAQ